MVLVFVILALACESSWQQETTEKSLNQMLEQLIEVSTYSNENENHSRVIYIKPDNITSRRKDDRGHYAAPSSEYEDLNNLVHQIKSFTHETNFPQFNSAENVIRQISIEVESSSNSYNDNSGKAVQEMELINDGISKSGRPLFEEVQQIPDNQIVSYEVEIDRNVIPQYPEIIIDQIANDGSEVQTSEAEKSSIIQNSRTYNMNNRKAAAAKALDSLLELLMNNVPKKKNPNEYSDQNDLNAVVRSTHIHNAFHNHVTNNLPLAFSSLPSHGKMLLDNVPQTYRDLHGIINRPRSAYLNANLQSNRWRGDAEQNSLMSILRAQNLNHVHFIPETLNMLSRVVYQPLYHHHHYIR